MTRAIGFCYNSKHGGRSGVALEISMGLRQDAFIGCAFVLSTMSAACASDMGDKQDGQPCTRSDQCASGLICSGGSCAAAGDGGSDHDAQPDEDAGRKDSGGK